MGVLDGIRVLDLSWGITGPMTTMLLADQGAEVTKVEPPGGDPWRQRLSGYDVWDRGKRSAFLDLTDLEDHRRVLSLIADADVLVESFQPGVTARLGIDSATLLALNPRLVYCSITGYGSSGPDSDRPGIDALVAARTGQMFESRGVVGGTLARLAGVEGMLPDLEAPADCWNGPERDGPLFSGVPWASLGAFYIASVGISAALRAREHTGRGQVVSASLLHGVLATTVGSWQQVEHADAPHFQTWIFDPRAPKGFFASADNRWTQHWVPLPEFILNADAAGMVATPDVKSPKDASLRVGTAPEDMILLHVYQEQMAEAVGRHDAKKWVDLAAEIGVPVQTVRSPEEALLDEALVTDGCVIEVDHPVRGPLRQVGRVVELSSHPQVQPKPAAVPGSATDEVRAEADNSRTVRPSQGRAPVAPVNLASPLDGIVVLDLGLAVAGPFGAQVLAQLGARVIKVNTTTDKYWFSNHIAMCCNRDKESITLNLKDERGIEILGRLLAKADVVTHNMRYDAAVRLGVDYESLKKLNPTIVYAHSIGHEQGPRQSHPGNDQTAGALAGTEWLDGSLDQGGRPVWSCLSLGDTGNGFLVALGIIQALYDRDRTGEGQMVRTSILYAHLLNASMASVSRQDPGALRRQQLDAEATGWSALYKMYETTTGWVCIAADGQDMFGRLCGVLGLPDVATDARFAQAEARSRHDKELASELAAVFASRPAAEWQALLDAAEVPCETADMNYVKRLFADPDAAARGLVAEFVHPIVGRMKMAGLYFDLSDTPGRLVSGPAWPGQDSLAILTELGYDLDEIAGFVSEAVVEALDAAVVG